MHDVESNVGQKLPLFEKNRSKFSFVRSSFCRENEIFSKSTQKDQKGQFSWVKKSATCLDQFLTQAWTKFWLKTCDTFWPFLFFNMLKPHFYSIFSKNCIFKPAPKIKNTICEHNCPNWKELFVPLSAFCFLGFLLCPFLLFFGEEEN